MKKNAVRASQTERLAVVVAGSPRIEPAKVRAFCTRLDDDISYHWVRPHPLINGRGCGNLGGSVEALLLNCRPDEKISLEYCFSEIAKLSLCEVLSEYMDDPPEEKSIENACLFYYRLSTLLWQR